MAVDNLIVERRDAVAIVTVNRPKVLNVLNSQAVDELYTVTIELMQDSSVRSVIVTGAGDRAFVAGGDIGELAKQSPTEGRERARRGQRVFDLIENMGKPVIAAVNGYALGGGCELAMACTLRLASDTAQFGQPEIDLALIPGYGGTQRLARLVGKGRALELLLTGARINAQEAWRIGLVNRVVPPGGLMSAAHVLAAELAAKPRVAVRYILDAVNRGLDGPLAQGTELEAVLFGLVSATEDMREGTKAFLEKRPAGFKGK